MGNAGTNVRSLRLQLPVVHGSPFGDVVAAAKDAAQTIMVTSRAARARDESRVASIVVALRGQKIR
jgi:hypothetical protein